eukprot:TRINITY_DN15711_c0_g2_i1.p3 TRINITY_DN15711_c0_g2~~TRINITY_DN15711_c0_g2_i1.p3  ORF type:complete len:189 (+),score=34.61 TRINITY_DN15711_c0_g2_i1:1-567(+)
MNIELRVPLTLTSKEYFGGDLPKYMLHVNNHLKHPEKKKKKNGEQKEAFPEIDTCTEAVGQHIGKLRGACNDFLSPFVNFKTQLANLQPMSQKEFTIGFAKAITLDSPSPFHELRRHGAEIQVVQQMKGYPYDRAARFGNACWSLMAGKNRLKSVLQPAKHNTPSCPPRASGYQPVTEVAIQLMPMAA